MGRAVSTNALEALNKRIQERITNHSEDLIAGNSQDFASYKYSIGLIYGLKLAQQELIDLDKIIEDA